MRRKTKPQQAAEVACGSDGDSGFPAFTGGDAHQGGELELGPGLLWSRCSPGSLGVGGRGLAQLMYQWGGGPRRVGDCVGLSHPCGDDPMECGSSLSMGLNSRDQHPDSPPCPACFPVGLVALTPGFGAGSINPPLTCSPLPGAPAAPLPPSPPCQPWREGIPHPLHGWG